MNALKSRKKYEEEKALAEMEAKWKAEQEMLDKMSEEEREAYKTEKDKRIKKAFDLLSIASKYKGDYSKI